MRKKVLSRSCLRMLQFVVGVSGLKGQHHKTNSLIIQDLQTSRLRLATSNATRLQLF